MRPSAITPALKILQDYFGREIGDLKDLNEYEIKSLIFNEDIFRELNQLPDLGITIFLTVKDAESGRLFQLAGRRFGVFLKVGAGGAVNETDQSLFACAKREFSEEYFNTKLANIDKENIIISSGSVIWKDKTAELKMDDRYCNITFSAMVTLSEADLTESLQACNRAIPPYQEAHTRLTNAVAEASKTAGWLINEKPLCLIQNVNTPARKIIRRRKQTTVEVIAHVESLMQDVDIEKFIQSILDNKNQLVSDFISEDALALGELSLVTNAKGLAIWLVKLNAVVEDKLRTYTEYSHLFVIPSEKLAQVVQKLANQDAQLRNCDVPAEKDAIKDGYVLWLQPSGEYLYELCDGERSAASECKLKPFVPQLKAAVQLSGNVLHRTQQECLPIFGIFTRGAGSSEQHADLQEKGQNTKGV